MVLHNPNNWHWVSKDCTSWTKDYLNNNLSGISAEEDGTSVAITSLSELLGDVDVSQRKGKVITIYEITLTLDYKGQTKDGEEVTGNITIPEVAYDTEENEYVFNISTYAESESKLPVKSLIKKSIVPQIRTKLLKLTAALISEHGKDIQHAPGSNPSSGFHTPTYLSNDHKEESHPDAGTSTVQSSKDAPFVNTVTLKEEAEFRTDAESLFRVFTDPQLIAAFTRAPPVEFTGAQVGGKFSLFGGNVSGEYVSLDHPTKLVQKWRLRQWPEGHFSTLTLSFNQNNVDHVTVMKVEWKGVPVGQEEVTERNWNEYYVKSIKTTFGYGTVL